MVAEILVALTKNALSSRLRRFTKMVVEILVALTKNALSSGPKGRLGRGPARRALARLPRGIPIDGCMGAFAVGLAASRGGLK